MLVCYRVCLRFLIFLDGLVQLSRKVMDMRELRRIACQGVPDSAGIRSTLWKVVTFVFRSVSSLVLVRTIDVRIGILFEVIRFLLELEMNVCCHVLFAMDGNGVMEVY